MTASELVYGTCVAFGDHAALLRGRSGAGKSDLALCFLALPGDGEARPALVADDQVLVAANDKRELIATAPATIAGQLEVRGIGIVAVPQAGRARLCLVVDLVSPDQVPRLPLETWETVTIAGVAVPRLSLAPFQSSAALKLKLALISAISWSSPPHP